MTRTKKTKYKRNQRYPYQSQIIMLVFSFSQKKKIYSVPVKKNPSMVLRRFTLNIPRIQMMFRRRKEREENVVSKASRAITGRTQFPQSDGIIKIFPHCQFDFILPIIITYAIIFTANSQLNVFLLLLLFMPNVYIEFMLNSFHFRPFLLEMFPNIFIIFIINA